MSDKQAFEAHPKLTEIIQHFAAHVPVDLSMWSTLLTEINNALQSASSSHAAQLDIDTVLSDPPPGHEKIPFDPNILKQMEGHEQRADKSWEDIEKRISQPAAVNGIDATPFESNTERHSVTGLTTGAVWVTFSERLPSSPGRYRLKEEYSADFNGKVFTNCGEDAGACWLDESESPTAAGETEEEIFDQYRAIKEKIGKLGYNTFINSKEVEEYREWLRNDRYKHRLEWFEKEYPNGIYSRDEDNGFYGISIMTKKFLAEADAAYENATAAGDGEPRETIENILYATGKFYEEQCTELADVILKEMKGTGDGKEDAVAFMNWSLSSECDTYNCTDEDEWTNIYTKETITTAQLYDIFKQQNK